MRRIVPLVLALFFGACSRDAAKPAQEPPPALSNVVAAELARLEARIGAETKPAAPAPTPIDLEELRGLLGTLAEPRSSFREAALRDVKSFGASAIAPLESVALDASAPTSERTAAIEALAAIGAEPAPQVLLRVLESAPEPWMRAHAAWRLGEVATDGVVPRMLLRLKYEVDAETVIWLADSLARRSCYAGVDGLRVVRDTNADEGVRSNAAQRGAEIAARAGAADLDALARDWASGALEIAHPPPPPGRDLEREAWIRIDKLRQWDLRVVDDCRFVLARLPAWIVEPLTRALRDDDVYVRVHAAQCLERMGPRARSASTALLASLRDPRAASAAAMALGATGATDAAPDLERILASARDIDLRVAAATALGALALERSHDALRQAAAVDAIDLRQAALLALARSGRADEVAPALIECMRLEGADHEAAQRAIEAWLSARAQRGDQGIAELLERWRALAPAAGTIESTAQALERNRARLALVDALVKR